MQCSHNNDAAAGAGVGGDDSVDSDLTVGHGLVLYFADGDDVRLVEAKLFQTLNWEGLVAERINAVCVIVRPKRAELEIEATQAKIVKPVIEALATGDKKEEFDSAARGIYKGVEDAEHFFVPAEVHQLTHDMLYDVKVC